MSLFHFGAKRKILSLFFCTLCNASIQTKNQGFLALNEHAKTKTHVRLCKDLKNGSQAVITGGKSSNSLACFSYSDSIIRSELIWALHVV